MSYPVRPVTVSSHVSAHPDDVFAFVSDTRNDPVWCPNVADVAQVRGDGVATGSKFRFHQTIQTGGRTLESEVEVEVVELGERYIVWFAEDRFQTRAIRLEVSGDDDSSVITQTTSPVFKGKPGLARWLYPWLARRAFKEQFNRLVTHFV
jgi:hypothetical protein